MADTEVVDTLTGISMTAVTDAGGLTYQPQVHELTLAQRIRRHELAQEGIEYEVPHAPEPPPKCGELTKKGDACKAFATESGRCVGHQKQHDVAAA